MGCAGRYAEAWQYAAFWCVGSLLLGKHLGAGPADPALVDSQVNFLQSGAKPNVGMVLYNLTAGTEGPVVTVQENSLAATGVTWAADDSYRVCLIDARQRSAIEHYLDTTATPIHAVRAASGGCDCTPAPWANDYLANLNIVMAGIFHECPCARPALSDERAARYQEWVTGELDKIRDCRIELCDGATGAEFPAIAWAEQTLTEFNQARILVNRAQRGG